ncbi:hypothetical protein N9089_00205 [Crocinitomicaceae bacterium]|nr:hypothetical protein [Crocinitomicaceae bacterium]
MLKRFALFILTAAVLVGCSSDEEKEKSIIMHQEGVYAFINSNKDVVAFGHIDVQQFMKKGKVESNPLISTFAGGELAKLKEEVDLTAPIHYAVVKDAKTQDPKSYFFVKLKDKAKLVQDMKMGKGFVIKETNGITYTEDGDFVVGMKDEMIIIAIQSGDFDGAKVVNEAFKFAAGKQPDSKLKAKIDRAGDFTATLLLESMVDEIPSSSTIKKSDLKGAEMLMTLNSEKGKLVLEAEWNVSKQLKDIMGLSKMTQPLLAKKIVGTESGQTISAFQLSGNATQFAGGAASAEELDESLNSMLGMLSFAVEGLEMQDLQLSENLKMPEGQAIGSKIMELFIDFDALAASMDMKDAAVFVKELDYATYEVTEDKLKIVIKSHRSDENFLATILEVASGAAFAMMGGGGNMSF